MLACSGVEGMCDQQPPREAPERKLHLSIEKDESAGQLDGASGDLTAKEDARDPLAKIVEQLILLVSNGDPPELLDFGGEEAFERYREVFSRVYSSPQPIVDPQGRVISFDHDYCRHVCFSEDRFDKRRRRFEGETPTRDHWDQSRAEHILWILPALTAPSLIVRNNQQDGNLTYLLGYPTREVARPRRRFYASVKPVGPNRAVFKTAYTITQEQWDRALRAPPHRRSQKHVLYRRPDRRW